MHLRAQTIPFYHLQRLLSPSLRLSPTPAPSIHLSLSLSFSTYFVPRITRFFACEKEGEREREKLTNSKKETSFFFAIFKREISRFHGPSMNGTIVKSDRIDSNRRNYSPNSFPFLPPLFFCSIHHLFFFLRCPTRIIITLLNEF